jgi:hypothetical protein
MDTREHEGISRYEDISGHEDLSVYEDISGHEDLSVYEDISGHEDEDTSGQPEGCGPNTSQLNRL